MKYLYLILIVLCANLAFAQNYNNIVSYAINGTPVNGVKIKTNLPFIPSSHMPTITITGYNYGSKEAINLTLVYYPYSGGSNFNDPANYFFLSPMISSSGAYTPKVLLSAENGKVVIFIDDKGYFQRFTVSVFSKALGDVASYFEGWTAVDEALNGVKTVEVPYKNRFKGNVYYSGNGVWDTNGNVGIGTINPTEKLSVNGKIRAQEIKVETANWPDYVFEEDYKVETLEGLESYIKANKHLPEIPSAKETEANGIELGEMNKLLLKKIEELTLYVIELKKGSIEQQKQLDQLKKKLD